MKCSLGNELVLMKDGCAGISIWSADLVIATCTECRDRKNLSQKSVLSSRNTELRCYFYAAFLLVVSQKYHFQYAFFTSPTEAWKLTSANKIFYCSGGNVESCLYIIFLSFFFLLYQSPVIMKCLIIFLFKKLMHYLIIFPPPRV